MIYSHSRISCFENCPLKFRLKYIDKLKPEIETTIEAFMGTLVHATLEKLYKDLRFQKMNSLEDLLAFYNAEWKMSHKPGIRVVRKGYDPENYRKMGEACIRNYYETNSPFDDAKTVGLEQKVMLELDGGRHKLQGFIDRLAYAGKGVYEIHDYKTGASMPLEEQLENDRQLALYAMAVREKYPDAKDVKLIWHYLHFNLVFPLRKTGDQLERLRQETIEMIDKIEAAESFPHRPSRLCDWCEFRCHCPEFSHLSEVESLPEEKFKKEPGVKLVDTYVELSEKKKEIEDRLEEVKQALVEFSRKKGASLVIGSGANAKIWEAEKLKFPGKGEKGRKELEKVLAGLGKWEEVSSLDAFALSKALDEGRWPEEIAKIIRAFGSEEMISRVYLKKKDGSR